VADAAATPDARQVAADVPRWRTRATATSPPRSPALLLRQTEFAAVSVEVHAGIVTLGGTVPEEDDRTRVATLAKSVKGVTTWSIPSSSTPTCPDAWIVRSTRSRKS
jgi:hypothetical protein